MVDRNIDLLIFIIISSSWGTVIHYPLLAEQEAFYRNRGGKSEDFSFWTPRCRADGVGVPPGMTTPKKRSKLLA
jgi:hypothetical protein